MSYVSSEFDEQIVELLSNGGVGFMPSDTIYGLSARALDEQAVERIHKIKLRDEGKPFIVLISNVEQLDNLGLDSSVGRELAQSYWPGALTIVFPALSTPAWLTKGLSSLAVRLPDDKNLTGLIERVGPIVSTSANESAQPVITNVRQAQETFGKILDFYVDAGRLDLNQPSTIVKPTPDGLQILRQGTVIIKEGEKL